MAGLLNNAFVVLVLITVAKPFIAAVGDTSTETPTTSALGEASQEPEEPTQRDGKFAETYPAELCNSFYQFWTNHSRVWTVKTSDSVWGKCKRQEPKNLTETGVILTATSIDLVTETLVSTYYFWEFRPDGSMAHHHKYSTGQDMLLVIEYLIFENVNKTCGVVERREWWYHDDKSCTESGCECKPSGKDDKPYMCLGNPIHEVVVDDKKKDNVPEECTNVYDRERTKFRKDDHVVYTNDCSKNEQ